MAKIQIKNSFITSSADITISSSMVKFSSGISAKNITGSFSGSIPALTSYYKQGGNSFGTTAILGTNDNQALTFETNASEKVRIATDGNVGIGTTSPAHKLQLGTLTSTSTATPETLSLGGTFSNTGGSNPKLRIWTDGTYSIGLGVSSNQLDYILGRNFFDHVFYAEGSRLMTIKGGGNVGIGTTTVDAKLRVLGNVRATSFTGSFSGSVVGSNVFVQGGNSFGTTAILGTSDNQALILETNNTEKVRITTAGNVGIGTTIVAATFHVVGQSFLNNVVANTAKNQLTINVNGSNYAQFYDIGVSATNALAIGGSTGITAVPSAPIMTWALSSGNVGIGTSSPAYKLDVIGPGTSNGVTLRLSDAASLANSRHILLTRGSVSGSIGIAGSQTNDPLWISRSSGYDLMVASSGNIGIGTSIPSQLLELKKTSASVIALLNYNDSVKFNINASSAGAGYVGMISNHPLLFVINDAEKVRIDTNGNVGIGTSSPADKLHVIGNVRINGGDILNWSGQAFIQTLGNYDMFFRPNSTLQMILTGNGNIGIGSGFTNPLAKLHVSGSSTSVSAIFNGNVGIGTTSPVAKLSVYTTSPHGSPTGISVAAGTGGANLLARDSGNYHNWFPYTDGFNYYSADSHVFRSSNHLTNYVYINSSGNLGIGTTNPTQRLDLSGSLRIRSAGTYSDPTDNAGFINYDSTGGIFTISARSNGGSTYMAFRTSNSGTGGERMRIINDGNIGIGTSTPSYLLDVYSGNQDVARFYNNQTTFGFILGSTANTLFTNLLWTTSTGNAQFFKNRSNTSWGGADSFNFYTSNGGFAWHPAGVANAMYLTTSGNLGIGSTSPTSAASFNKVVEAYDATSLSYQVNSGGTYKAEFGISSAGGWLGTSTTHDMRLVSNGTERMRITSGGNVGIGTTSPASLLQVGGSSGATATPTAITFDNTFRNAVGGNTSLKIYLYKSGGETYGFGLNNAGGIEYHVGASGGGSAYHAFYTETTEKVRINSAGNLGIGTTSPTARLHISSSSNDGLAQFKIEGVNAPSTFNWASTFINSALGSSRNYISLIGQALSSRNSGYIGFNHSGTSGSTSNFLTFGLYGVDNILNINGSGNVGIGTTSPNAKLQVVGNVRATSFTGSFSGSVVGSNMFVQGGNSFGTTAILGTSDNQALILETNNTEKLRITTGGNLLIGNSSGTGYRLNVKSPFASAVGGAYIEVGEFNQKTLVINNTNPSVSSNLFEAQKSGSAVFVINSAGNVGIGTTSPATLLHVDTSGADARIRVSAGTNTVQGGMIANSGTSLIYAGSITNHGFSLRTNDTDRVRIDTSGNVGIGTTSVPTKLTTYVGSGTISGTNDAIRLQVSGYNDTAKNTIVWAQDSGNFVLGRYGLEWNFSTSQMNFVWRDIYNSGVGTTELMRLTGGGNVGIGTTSPVAKLDVNGTSNFAANVYHSIGGQKFFAGSGGTYAYIYTGTTALNFINGNDTSTLMTLLNGGNVGIGTTSPTQKLHVVGNARINGIGAFGIVQSNWDSSIYGIEMGGVGNALWANASSYIELNNNGYFDSGGWKYANTAASSRYELGVGGHYWFTAASGTAGNALTWSERMRIDNNGNVGIGTTSPAAKLHINGGNVYVDSGYNYTSAAGSGYWASGLVSPYQVGWYESSGAMLFRTGGSEKVRIDTNGNVGIGSSSPAYKLDINGTGRFTGDLTTNGNIVITRAGAYLYINGTNSDAEIVWQTNGSHRWAMGMNVGDATENFNIYNYTTATTNFTILKANGNVGIGSTAPNDKLDVVGRVYAYRYIAVSSNASLPAYATDTSTGMFNAATNQIGFTINGSERLRIDTNGNLGIGTTSPSRQLELYGNNSDAYIQLTRTSTAYQSTLGFKTGATDDWLIRTGDNSTSNLLFYSYGTSTYVMTILRASGNVGIGTTSPGTLLQVHGSNPFVRINNTITGDHGIKISYNNSDTHGLHLLYNANSALSFIDNTYPTSSGQVYGDIYFRQNVAGTMTTRMTIKADGGGNVGIGTTAPGYKLDVNGPIGVGGFRFIDQSTHYFRIFEPAGNIALYLGNASDPANYYDNTTHYFRNRGGSSNYVIINSSGNLGIGTSTVGAPLTIYKASNPWMRINGGGAFSYIQLDDGTSYGYLLKNTSSDTSNNALAGALYTYTDSGKAFQHIHSGTPLFTILSGGSVGIGTTSPGGKLEVRTNTASTYIFSGTSTSGYTTSFTMDDTASYIGHDSAARSLTLRTNSTDRLSITGGGNIGIGSSSPACKLDVAGTIRSTSSEIFGFGASDNVSIRAASSVNVMGLYTSNSEKVRLAADGNLGIGTSNPAQKLHVVGAVYGTTYGQFGTAVASGTNASFAVFGSNSAVVGVKLVLDSDVNRNDLVVATTGNIGIGTSTPGAKLNTYASGSNLSVFKVDGGNGTLFEVTDQLSGSLFSVNDVSGLPLLEVFSNNRIVAGKYNTNALVISGSSVGIGTATPAYKLQVNGSFGATTKSFVIDHPTKQGKKLVYGSLESPYHGIRLTGRNVLIDGECKVQLPDYIYKLARSESVNIQITPIKCGKVIYVDEISVPNNYFVVKYDKSMFESYKNYEFFWDFTATRNDVDELIVEQ